MSKDKVQAHPVLEGAPVFEELRYEYSGMFHGSSSIIRYSDEDTESYIVVLIHS